MAADEHTGGMICLVPDAASAQLLVLDGDGAEPLDQLHLTLAYLGDDASALPDDVRDELPAAVRTALAEAGIAGPLVTRAFAHTAFNADGGPDGDRDPCAVYGIGDSELLEPLHRAVVGNLGDVDGLDLPEQHAPWIPHVTASYSATAADLSFLGEVTFDGVAVVLGANWDVIPLTEGNPMTAAAPVSYGQDRNLPDPTGWVRGTIPVVVVEGMRTGDGRLIPEGTLTGHRALPLALMSLSRTSEGGHLDATVFGRIDHLERVPGPTVTNIDTGEPFPDGTFVWRSDEAYVDPQHPDYRLLHAGALTGISVDLAETEADFEFDEDDPDAEPLLSLVRGRIAASTLCTIPAFPGAHFVLPADAPAPGADVAEPAPLAAAAGPTSFRLEHESGLCASCTAPPTAWFDDPGLDEATPLTVTEDGRVFGHIAAWGICHTGLPGCTTAPRSSSGYRYFLTGAVLTADGVQVPVGRLTVGTGHADLDATAAVAASHYDHTGAAVADVAVGEDAHGIWCAGAVRPGVTDEQLRVLRASPPSGDWRPIGGALELVAALCVNVPGFPVPRVQARVASGAVPLALVAAGALPNPDTTTSTPSRSTAMADDDTAPDTAAPEPGTAVAIGDTDLVGVVTEVLDGTALVAVEVPLERLTPAEVDEPVEDQLAAMRTAMDAMALRMRTLEAQRVLDRV